MAQYEAMYPSRKLPGSMDTSFQDYNGSESNYGGVVYPIYNPNNVRQDFAPPAQQQQQQSRGYDNHFHSQQQQPQQRPYQQQQQQQPIYVPHQPQSYLSDDERIPRQNYEQHSAPKVQITESVWG